MQGERPPSPRRATATRELEGGWDRGVGTLEARHDTRARRRRQRRVPRGLGGIGARRARHDAGQLLPAAAVVLLATVLAAAAPIYATAAQTAGVRATVAGAPPAQGAIRASAGLDGRPLAEVDAAVRAAIAEAVAPATASVAGGAESRSFGGDAFGEDGLVRFLAAEGLAGEAALDAGRWPATTAAGAELEAALPAGAAAALDLEVGETLATVSRFDAEREVAVRVVGVFRLTGTAALVEDDDGLLRTGVYNAGGFVTYGPLVVTTQELLARVEPDAATVRWWGELSPSALVPQDLDRIGRGVTAFAEREGDGVDVDTRLPEVLGGAALAAERTAGTAAVALLQLAIVAVAALLLVAGALTDDRRAQAGLLRSRGARPAVVGLLAGAEAALLAVPAAILGPLLAVPLVRAAGALPPPLGAGLALPARALPVAWMAAALAALGCVLGLAVPAALSARSLIAARAARARRPAAAAALAAGADLALLGLAVVGLLQLRGAGGEGGLDPVLVAAPAVGLLAAATLCLRLLSRGLGLLDRLTDRWAGGITALGARAVARRRPGALRAVSLPLLAVATGVLALTTGASWRAAGADRADFAAGADLRVAVTATPDGALSLPGVAAGTAVWHSRVALDRTEAAQVVALDAAAAPAIVPLRPDLADRPLDAMAADLVAGRPDPAELAIPEGAAALEVTLRTQALRGTPEARLTAVVRGTDGLYRRLHTATVALQTEGELRLDLPLPPGGPLTLAGLELGIVPTDQATLDLAVTRILALPGLPVSSEGEGVLPRPSEGGGVLPRPSEGGGVLPLPSGDGAGGGVVPTPLDAGTGWHVTAVPVREAALPSEVVADPAAGAVLAVSLRTPVAGARGPVTVLRATPARVPDPGTVPVLADPALVSALGGRDVALRVDGLPSALEGRVVGVVTRWPGTDAARPVVVADLPTLAALAWGEDGTVLPAEELLLAVDGDPAPVAEALLADGVTLATPIVREDLRAAARLDPVAAGLLGALALATAGAAGAGALGFAVGARAAVRARRVELAALRALGLTALQVRRSLLVEQGLLAGFALLAGAVAGLVVASAFAPAALPAGVPPARLVVPALPIVVLVAAIAAVVVLAAVLTARAGRRTASLLREGEDQ